jgi:hypothetical protein
MEEPLMTAAKHVFLDTETTGLELHHDIWEIAWAIGDGSIESRIVPHSLQNADPKALELNGYWTRGFAEHPVESADVAFRELLDGATIIGCNPGFDAIRLQLRWRAQPWHYRLVDVSSMAVALMGFREDGLPPGLFDIANDMRRLYGLDIPEPDHTAAGDVATLRAVYYGFDVVRMDR